MLALLDLGETSAALTAECAAIQTQITAGQAQTPQFQAALSSAQSMPLATKQQKAARNKAVSQATKTLNQHLNQIKALQNKLTACAKKATSRYSKETKQAQRKTDQLIKQLRKKCPKTHTFTVLRTEPLETTCVAPSVAAIPSTPPQSGSPEPDLPPPTDSNPPATNDDGYIPPSSTGGGTYIPPGSTIPFIPGDATGGVPTQQYDPTGEPDLLGPVVGDGGATGAPAAQVGECDPAAQQLLPMSYHDAYGMMDVIMIVCQG